MSLTTDVKIIVADKEEGVQDNNIEEVQSLER